MPDFTANTVQVHIASENSSGDFSHLVLQRSETCLVYPGLWQVVTGRIEPDETALQCAVREAIEETGLEIKKLWTVPYLTSFFDARRNKVNFSAVFGILADMNRKVIISEEHSAFEWLPIDEFIKRLELPTHVEGTKIFQDYILNPKYDSKFLINPDEYL